MGFILAIFGNLGYAQKDTFRKFLLKVKKYFFLSINPSLILFEMPRCKKLKLLAYKIGIFITNFLCLSFTLSYSPRFFHYAFFCYHYLHSPTFTTCYIFLFTNIYVYTSYSLPLYITLHTQRGGIVCSQVFTSVFLIHFSHRI